MATNVTATTAQLLGRLNATQSVFAVTVYWGPNDGSNNIGAWAESAYVGTYTNVVGQALGAVADGLAMNTGYFYAYRATNAVTNLWAQPSKGFTTQDAGVEIVSPTNNALLIEGDVPVEVSASEDGSVTNVSVYTNGVLLGTATNGGGGNWGYVWAAAEGGYALTAEGSVTNGTALTSTVVNVTIDTDFDLDGDPDSTDPDDDDDGIPDDYENTYPTVLSRTNPLDWDDDPDLDLRNNYHEWISLTIPTNGQSVLQFAAISNLVDGTWVYFESATGRVYEVLWSTNILDPADWHYATNGVPGTDAVIALRVTIGPDGAYYLLGVSLP